MSEKVRPVCLPNSGTETSGTLTVAGWGLTESGENSNSLLETSVTEYDWNKCNSKWKALTENHLCASLDGKSFCDGDSGGPLTARQHGKNYIVGIVAIYAGKCGEQRDSVYTKVVKYLDWIRENTKDGVYCSQ
ncbi:serine protease hepsin-like protein [Leptotrombidium deliense]|uniref:Serine protease hepsin-like protein n=1 Tax=Leptotrombidium deliense TaxID=299467 RepID=A0A443SF70_9ACAR|nr:serine protease hepsin-like protein [Leptotrombidium deliense]